MPHWFDLPEDSFSELLRIIGVYHREARRCRDSKAYLAGCVMAGAALEALLLAMVSMYGDELPDHLIPRPKGKAKRLLKWTLAEMIRAARSASWLPSGLELDARWDGRRAQIGDYAEVLHQIRNLVHAARYLQDHSPRRVTRKYLQQSLEILDASRSHLEAKVHESLRKDMELEAHVSKAGP